MRSTIFKILTLLFLVPLFSSAQNEAPKGTNRITVQNNLEAEENYKLALTTATEQGYDIEIADKKNYLIKTQEATTKKWSLGYYVNIIAKDNSIIITGKLRRSSTVFTDIKNGGLGFGVTFQELDKLAKSFEGSIVYSTK